MLRMLSPETLEFLESIAQASDKAYPQGGTVFAFSTADYPLHYHSDDAGRTRSNSSRKAFHSELAEADLTELARLLRGARGYANEVPTLPDIEFATHLLGLLKKDLAGTAITFLATDDTAGMSGTIEMMAGYNSFSLDISWSYD